MNEFSWVMFHTDANHVIYTFECILITYEWIHIWMNSLKACHTRMQVMSYSHMNEFCHLYIWTGSVTYARVMSRTNESCHVWSESWHIGMTMSPVTRKWLSNVTLMSRHTLEEVMPCAYKGCRSSPPCSNQSLHLWKCMHEPCHVSISHITHEWVIPHMNESCHTGVMSHMNESCHIWMSHVTYEWVMSHMNESCHIWMSHVTYEW